MFCSSLVGCPYLLQSNELGFQCMGALPALLL
jgi:hypothetical protein